MQCDVLSWLLTWKCTGPFYCGFFQVHFSPPPHLLRPWQSRPRPGLLWGGASNRLHSATLWAAGRGTPSFTAGVSVSTQHPSLPTICWGAAAPVRGSKAPDWESIWQRSAGEGGNGKATGGHDECAQNERDRSGREGQWDRAAAMWPTVNTGKDTLHHYVYTFADLQWQPYILYYI